ncbi:hypothetical protein CBF34_00970 [Vagococcus penaei]|uniref:Uncharacterized protein n=1 Tax=Vagococcus penaei TaxID=633807 RepID=A0A1Q2D8D3_9ENTE|nr:MerR family transcriptional regulator [Vagococcus penaei]AQP54600.1 hypothetical protein BW732_10570 [Vagococcus penaei]RSU06687.1 hypothetical protein CBF34_00970 [Vagococcus penaei]
MTYTISELANLSGVTTRTLRYYDQIGLLKPTLKSPSGYRLYTQKEVDCLEQILFFKTFGFSLQTIQLLLQQTPEQRLAELIKQKTRLINEKNTLNQLITSLDQSIKTYQGDMTMTNTEKFRHFMTQKITENQDQYGHELTQTYSEETLKQSQEKWMHLSPADYHAMLDYEASLFATLNLLLKTKSPDLTSHEAQKAFQAHKNWLQLTAPFYHREYHLALAEMYLADDRFATYYNTRTEKPSAQLLHDIITYYA